MGTKAKIVVKRKPCLVKPNWDGWSVEQSQVWAYQVSGEGMMYDSLEALEEAGLYKKLKPSPFANCKPYRPFQWWSDEQEEETITSITLGTNPAPARALRAGDGQLFPHCHLPALVEENIFARLPLSSLMTSKAVSCVWESRISTLPATSTVLDAHTLVFTLFSKTRSPVSNPLPDEHIHSSKRQQLVLGSPLQLALWREPGTHSQSQKMSLSLLPPGNRCSCPKGYTLACTNGGVFVFDSTPSYLVGNPVTGQYAKVGARRVLDLEKDNRRLALLLSSSEPLVFKLVCLELCRWGVEVQIYDSLTDKWQKLLCRHHEQRWKVLASAWDSAEAAWYWLLGDYDDETLCYLQGYRVEVNQATTWLIHIRGGLEGWGGSKRRVCCMVCSKGRLLLVCRELRGDDFVIQMWGLRLPPVHREPAVEVVLESEEVVENGMGLNLSCCSDGCDRVWVMVPGLPEVDDLLLRYEMSSKSWRRYELSGCRLGVGEVAGIEGMAFTGELRDAASKLTDFTTNSSGLWSL